MGLGVQQGVQQGAQQATEAILLRLITRYYGELDAEARARLTALPFEQKEKLAETVLDFDDLAAVVNWLEAQASQH